MTSTQGHVSPAISTTPSSRELTLVQAINQALQQVMEKDDRVILLGEDIGVNGGVFRVTDGLHATFGGERVIDTPLAESGIIGTAIGLSIGGMIPVAEIQFEGFLGPAYDQIHTHAARFRSRTRSRFPIGMTIRVPVGGGIHAPELHSDSPEATYAHIPGLKVVMPSNPYDAKGLLISAIQDPDPVIFFEPKRIYRAFRQDVPAEQYTIPIGSARVVSEGEDMTIISWGATIVDCMNAIEASEHSIELVDLRTISPMDSDTVLRSVKKTGRAMVVHEAPKTAGLGAEIVARIMEHAFLHLQAPVQRVTGFDTTMPYYKLELEYLPGVSRIGKAIEELAAY